MKTLYIVDTLNQIGQEVELKGWINTKRDHKKIVFLDLRDKTGIVQVVGGEEFKTLSPKAVISIRSRSSKGLPVRLLLAETTATVLPSIFSGAQTREESW